MPGRVIPHRLPSCPGQDSRYTIRHNANQPTNPWWIYYEPPGANRIPADDPHRELIDLVNALKVGMGQTEGGCSASMNTDRPLPAWRRLPGRETACMSSTSAGAVFRLTLYRSLFTKAAFHRRRPRPRGSRGPVPCAGCRTVLSRLAIGKRHHATSMRFLSRRRA